MISIKVAALGLAMLAVPAMAGPIVVRALGPSAATYKPGSRLPDMPLVLKAGDSLTVLDAKGTRSFSGPGTFNLAAASERASGIDVAALIVQEPPRRARIGAVRGTAGADAGPAKPPGIWSVDVSQSTTVCALDPAKLALWRADTNAVQTMTLKGANGETAKVEFAAGAPTVVLPAIVAKEGPLAIVNGKSTVTLKVKKLAPAEDLEALGAAMAGAGCMNQFERLAAASAGN
jgi:hypothetical protein